MARLTLTDARRLAGRGRPWTFRMECTTGRSNKFWLATGRGVTEPVEIHYGRIGTRGTVIVKDWSYVEQKAPEKEAKGYVYVPTPFIRADQAIAQAKGAPRVKPTWPASHTVGKGEDVRNIAGMYYGDNTLISPILHANNLTNPLHIIPGMTLTIPDPKSGPAATVGPTIGTTVAAVDLTRVSDEWVCKTGGVRVRLKRTVTEIVFDVFPAAWQPTAYHTFKDDVARLCANFLGRSVKVTWEGDNGEIFIVRHSSKPVFVLIVTWLRGQIPVAAPLIKPPALTGPYKAVRFLKPLGDRWDALNEHGTRLFSLTPSGARSMIAQYPDRVQVLGL